MFNEKINSVSNMEAKREAQKKSLIFTIYLLMAIIVLLIAACAYLGTRPKSVPWAIEIGSDGRARYYPGAVKLLTDYTPSDYSRRRFLKDYVMLLRSVYTDDRANVENAGALYRTTLNVARESLNKWFATQNPNKLNKSSYVEVPENEISVVKYDDLAWKVIWRETTHRRSDNAITGDKQYEGVFHIAYYTPTLEEDRIDNPDGLYVVDFDVSMLRNLM